MRRRNFEGNIHVVNLPEEFTAAELAALFDEHGLVLGAQIRQIPSNSGRLLLGVVALAPDDAADRAILALQGFAIGGQKLRLRRAKVRAKTERSAAPARPERSPLTSAQQFPARARLSLPPHVVVEYRTRRFPVRG